MQAAHDFVLLSLIKGKRLRNIVSASTDRLLGTQVDVEDLRKNYYCIASNCSQACEPDQPADDRQPMPSSL